jgi:hypothetical protein
VLVLIQRGSAGRCFRAVVVAAAALIATGCAGSESAQPSGEIPPRSTSIVFWEAITVPLRMRGDRVVKGVITASLVNEGSSEVSIVEVAPIADPGLRVDYLGYSTCARGCVGADEWNAETAALVKKGVEGRLPIELLPLDDLKEAGKPSVSLTFRLSADGQAGVSALSARCLRLQGVIATLADGSRVSVAAPDGHFVGAATRAEPRPSGYEDCDSGKIE